MAGGAATLLTLISGAIAMSKPHPDRRSRGVIAAVAHHEAGHAAQAMDDDILHTAIHEAAHAVIGRRLGMVCGHVTLEPDDDSSGHSITADPWTTDAAWENRGKYRHISSVYRGRILTYMAAAEAEVVCLGRCNGGDGEDQRQIGRMMDSAFNVLDGAAWEHLEARLRFWTRVLCRRHQGAIERVASELLKRKSLSSSDVDALIQAPKAPGVKHR